MSYAVHCDGPMCFTYYRVDSFSEALVNEFIRTNARNNDEKNFCSWDCLAKYAERRAQEFESESSSSSM